MSKPVVRVKVVVDNSAKASSRGLVTFGRRIVLGPIRNIPISLSMILVSLTWRSREGRTCDK